MSNAYLEMKLAWELHQRSPKALTPEQREQVGQVAARQAKIETLILESSEAAQVVVLQETVARQLGEIRKRYPNDQEFQGDLTQQGLTAGDLSEEIRRDLHIEAVLDRVAASVPPATEVDAEIYYRLHPAAFHRPEHRRLRHILITFEGAEQRRKAQGKLSALARDIHDEAGFSAAALRHSECPTALEGGKLGLVPPGQLYPELDAVAFAMQAGEVSAITESPMGLHLLRCDEIVAAQEVSFQSALPRIVEKLTDARRQAAQQNWIKQLARSRAAKAEAIAA